METEFACVILRVKSFFKSSRIIPPQNVLFHPNRNIRHFTVTAAVPEQAFHWPVPERTYSPETESDR